VFAALFDAGQKGQTKRPGQSRLIAGTRQSWWRAAAYCHGTALGC
jgi:hypothetical protein